MSSDSAAAGTVHGEHRWDFVFAALYDRLMRRGEAQVMGRHRGELIAKARGRTLKIGACRCNRDTIASIAAAGFSTEHEDVNWKGVPPIVAPLVTGRAVKEPPQPRPTGATGILGG